MRRVWRQLVTGIALAGGIGVLISACAHDDQTIFIRHVIAPPAPGANGGCTYTTDSAQPSLSSGVMDGALASSYSATFLVGSQFLPQGNAGKVRAESSRIIVKGAVVRVLDAGGTELTSFTRLTSGFIDPAQGTSPSFAPVSVQVLDSKSICKAVGSITGVGQTRRRLVDVKVFGTTLGGQNVESNEYEFPIDICYGCLVNFPASAVNPNVPLPNCAAAASTSSSGSTGPVVPCNAGQDQPVDCRLCQGKDACDPAKPFAPPTINCDG